MTTMTMPEVFSTPHFDGETYEPQRDGERLASQLNRTFEVVRDGEWHTLRELAAKVGGSEAAVSARLRDLRKRRFGSHRIERKYVGDGVWMYQLNDEEGR